jgi:hypothetical protein
MPLTPYDPSQAPTPEEWLALDEQLRIQRAEDYHRAVGVEVPNLKAHAVLHAIVENQIAEGFAAVGRAMDRLIGEGLSRHEAIHAIASVLAEHLHELFNAKAGENKTAASYGAAVDKLTARRWLGHGR